MAEDISIIKGSKEDQYAGLIPQVEGLLTGESDLIANLANVTAALKQQFQWLWVGFYLVKQDELVLGHFKVRLPAHGLKKQRSLRYKLATGKNINSSRCRKISRSHCMQQLVKI